MTATAGDTLNAMRALLGTREVPDGSNRAEPVTSWYGLHAAWCAMAVSYALAKAGHVGIRFAWTPSGRANFQNGTWGTWHTSPRPGDLVFYSFGGQRTDHVGLVEAVHADGTMTTLEGNVGNACKRLRRRQSGGGVQGFGRPRYAATLAPSQHQPTATGGARTLALGSRGEDVRVWQTLLQGSGDLPKGKRHADGIFGPNTRAATIAFQRKLNVTPDGIVGPRTRQRTDELLRYLAALPKVDDRPATGPLLKRGNRGEGVRRLQARLRAHGHTIATDGVFGPRTLASVRAFQKAKGLAADGIVGPRTWAALGR